MAWPLASHFSAMLQTPRLAFRDPVLQRCVVEKNAQGQPRPWSGAFAVVYKATDQQGRNPFALRVFTTESPERRERYDHISAYLNERRLRCLCAFEYRDSAIRSAGDGKWYPLILMEWVQGDTLFQWARARSLEGNTHALAEAADKWLEVVQELRDAAVAHGDLQHANIMIDERGDIKLVDYDCLCVPALLGRRNQELGVEPYQHPARNGGTLLSLNLDHFSELVIYTALRALAAAPTLWQKHVESTGYDKLLFRSADLRSPSSSALCRDLQHLDDAGVRQMAECLCDLMHGPIDRVPPLSEVVGRCGKSMPGRNGGEAGRQISFESGSGTEGARDAGSATHPLPLPGRAQLDAKTRLPTIGGPARPQIMPGLGQNGVSRGSRPAPPPLHPSGGKTGSRPAPPPLVSGETKSGSRPAPPPRLPWIATEGTALSDGKAPLPDYQNPEVPPVFLESIFSHITRAEVAWVCLGFGITGFVVLVIALFVWRA